METLADLTLKLSTELTRLEKRCRRELTAAEKERDRALLATGGKTILTRYHKDLAKAKQTELETIDEADDARRREVLAAEDKRARELLKEERKYRASRSKALAKKRDADRRARSKWRALISAARREPLVKQRARRRAADEALERALVDSREAYHLAIEDARLAHRAALQDDLVDERLAVERAHRKAERIFTSAAIDYERAVARAEARMRADLVDHPEAQLAQQVHDGKVSEIRGRCEADKEALFGKFTRRRRQLDKKRRVKK